VVSNNKNVFSHSSGVSVTRPKSKYWQVALPLEALGKNLFFKSSDFLDVWPNHFQSLCLLFSVC
jgi:hypothetical protein